MHPRVAQIVLASLGGENGAQSTREVGATEPLETAVTPLLLRFSVDGGATIIATQMRRRRIVIASTAATRRLRSSSEDEASTGARTRALIKNWGELHTRQ